MEEFFNALQLKYWLTPQFLLLKYFLVKMDRFEQILKMSVSLVIKYHLSFLLWTIPSTSYYM